MTKDSCEPSGLQIVEKAKNNKLSPEQKAFNKLIKKIEQQRTILEVWQSSILLYQQKYAEEFYPLLVAFNEQRASMLRLLDNAYWQDSLTKTEKRKLADIIQELAFELIFLEGMESLKEIYNKYSDVDYDDDLAIENEAFDTDELFDDLFDAEAMFEADSEKEWQPTTKQSKPKKAQAKVTNQSIRDIFRTLAKALHPDREQDAIERERKTALMQRVNVAYKARDLFSLLALQLEVEQLNQASINALAKDRLKSYNTILREQLVELEREIELISQPFIVKGNSMNILSILHQQVHELKDSLRTIKSDVFHFRQVKFIKQWLKGY
ncbi:MAG: hypothetical protein Q7V63_05185 [Gammaproteobacteria bacterium]|nr:hypothetical protein [Gammaproteobacteria bacterium]